jgi:hypothetical protein
MDSLKKVGAVAGLLALVGSIPLIFHPVRVTQPLYQGPPREVVLVWQTPSGPLGFLLAFLGGLILFLSLPKDVRCGALGGLLMCCSIGLVTGFAFNDYHGWWWHTCKFVFWLGIASAIVGGFLAAHNLASRRRVPGWTVAPVFLALMLVVIGVCISGGTQGYYAYDKPSWYTPYPFWVDYAGDYLWMPLLIVAFQFFVAVGLSAGFWLGIVSRRRCQHPTNLTP